MGSPEIALADAPNPPHTVTVSSFLLGKLPVTNAEYDVFVRETGALAPQHWSEARFARPRQPVVGVNWDEAEAFCEWAGGTLPTEAEWELAARGVDGRRYPWGGEEPDERHACFGEDWNSGGPSDVGAHPAGAGPFGCEDLAGNVWEWARDGWRLDAHLFRTAQRDPLVPAEDNIRPLRGGCWRSIEPKLQAAYRNWSHRVVRHVTIGFRMRAPA
jgi:formylglycine-generating enzyme required for sulfatase activity